MRVMVVGDAMVDVYYIGAISRLNPECHAIPLVSIDRRIDVPGGCRNVARNLENLGIGTAIVSGNGDIEKHRILDGDRAVCRFDVGEELSPIEELPVGDFDAVVVSDYGKGSISKALIALIEHSLVGSNIPTFVDTKQDPDTWLDFTTCFFPNSAEFAKHKYAYKQARRTLVKQGEHGAELFKHGVRSNKFCSKATKITNVAGAGDTVLAAYVAAYLGLGTEKEAAEFAMQAAAVAVAHPTTYAPTFEEIGAMFPDDKPLHNKIREGLLAHA